jgi:TRAP-type C4-dicarboxylate transport system substrate-binding protein
MRGLKLRTAPEADFIALFQALKALPMAMPLGAMVPALTAHSIDGQEGVLPLISAAGLDTLQTHCALSNHIWDGQWLCISGTSWSRLPASLKDMVASVLNESAVSQRKDIAGADVTIRNTLTAQGMAFNPIDLSSFRAVLRQSGYYAALKSKVGDDAWAALEQYTGRLT